ncbi:MAG TPA: NUDIX domain-containing protein [Candidatus Saccharimonadales bacterium]|nr:NUDIX domain-containing protein [Candidatus Saccharimonadales bacterium]
MESRIDQTVVHTIAREVSSIIPYDTLEQEHLQDTAKWLRSGQNPFRLRKPDVPPKHLVSYFVLVDPGHRSILLVDHIKAQLWLPSGGHVELNELPRNAVLREAQEEFGLQAAFLCGNGKPFFVTVTQTVGLTPGHTDVSLWYLLRGNVHDRMQYDRSEFTDVEWYTFAEIKETDPHIFDPHLQRFTAKLAQYLQPPDKPLR